MLNCCSSENFYHGHPKACRNYPDSPSVSTASLLRRLFILNAHNLADMIANNCYYYFYV